MLEDNVFLLDILILDKFLFIEEAGVVLDLVIGSYGVRNDLTWVKSMRLGACHNNKNNNIDKLHGKMSIGEVSSHISVAKKSSNKKCNNSKTPSFALMLPCPSDTVVTMRFDSDQNNNKFELVSRFDKKSLLGESIIWGKGLYVKTISVRNRVGAAVLFCLANSPKSDMKKAMVDEPNVTINQAYLKTMEKKVEDLKTLIEVSAIISSTLDFSDLMRLVMEKAKGVMDAEACSILLYNKENNKLEFDLALCREEAVSDILREKVTLDMGQGIAGWVAENQAPLLIKDARTDNRFYPEADRLTYFTTRSLMAVPLVSRSGLIGVAEILNPKQKDFFSDDDLEIFQTLCRQVAIAIENARFHKESVEKEKLRQELEIASVIQKSFLPESPIFKKDHLTLSALNLSATQVGGDLYDFVELGPNRVGVFIGDVSGKGFSAALYMAKVISDFRYIASQVVAPEIAMGRLNSALAQAPRGMFLTGIFGIVDLSKKKVSLSVAGHPPFLWLTNGEVKVMNVASGPPLGILPTEYPSTEITLKMGDRLIFLTDGVFEAKNKEGKRLGFENLVSFIKGHMGEGNLIQKVVDHVNDFSKGLARADDLTVVELKLDPGA